MKYLEDVCVVCDGTGKFLIKHDCTYCNGTGEPNVLAEEFMRSHICQCIFLDRENCPICKKKCHHDSKLSPKQIIDSGYGGLAASRSDPEPEEIEEEELIIA